MPLRADLAIGMGCTPLKHFSVKIPSNCSRVLPTFIHSFWTPIKLAMNFSSWNDVGLKNRHQANNAHDLPMC